MAYSALLFKLCAFIPKKLLALLAAFIFVYFWGVSDGRNQIKTQVAAETIKHYKTGNKVDEEIIRLPDNAVLSELLKNWSK